MTATTIAALGALIADESRAEILTALMDGRAHTGSELSRHVGVAPSTVSEHLSKLLDAGMVVVEPQGRHRYWRLANPGIAKLLETLGASPLSPAPPGPSVPSELARARTCYDHLAGELAVEIYEALVDQGCLIGEGDVVEVSPRGLDLFAGIGVDTSTIVEAKRARARPCLDWTQRRHHLAGASGKALLDALLDNGWVRRGTRPRSLRIPESGREAIADRFGLAGLGRRPQST